MDLGLKDQVVLITGSSSGIGRAAAIAFGAEGARVGVTYHANRQGAEETAQKVCEAGGQSLVLHYDLVDPTSIQASVATLSKEWGSLQVLVNNAAPMEVAGPTGQLFEEVPLKNWEGMLRESLEGVVLTIQCALPQTRKKGCRRIVTVSSDAVDGWPGLGPYATAKAGLHGLSRTLAVELGPADILSNIVMPGAVMTERTEQNITHEQKEQIKQTMPTRRLITPQDVAALIVFLGSPGKLSVLSAGGERNRKRRHVMRKIIVEAEVSVDGAMGSENMEFWKQLYPFHSQDVTEYLNDLLFMPDALLMGQKTYKFFAEVWPARQGKDADKVNTMPKYVVSRTLKEPLTWNATLINGNIVEELKKLKQAPGNSLLQYGVGELTHTMLKAGLVDEIRILVNPFTFGEGPYIFEHMGINTLKLLETRTFKSGTVALHYQPI